MSGHQNQGAELKLGNCEESEREQAGQSELCYLVVGVLVGLGDALRAIIGK